MKRLFRILSAALIVLLSSCGTVKLSRTERRHIPAPMQGVPEQIIIKKGYTTSYNQNTLQPNWVFWRLIADHVNGDEARSGNAYHEERKVAKPRATLADYRRSGFSRGHMCPAGDNKWDKQAMYDSFSLINICPQTERCNSGVWNNIEMQCREWALEYGELYIVSGPIFRSRPETIGPNKVPVPDAFFKVVVCMNGKKKGIGFICDNIDRNQTMKKCVVTIDEIERITGIDFFPHLTAHERHAVEDRANLRDW
ncbi:MAG: DNA/RNA non-specific endonuclease [Bacteroidales bacterium]|nr:DNA/RNA non-specific endonuclease [Bacteroidales bacterium]